MNESLPGNPHVSNDLHIYASGSSSANQANVAATLALAYEQRTANLIAKMALGLQMIQAAGAKLESTDAEWDALDDAILARLGLGGDAS